MCQCHHNAFAVVPRLGPLLPVAVALFVAESLDLRKPIGRVIKTSCMHEKGSLALAPLALAPDLLNVRLATAAVAASAALAFLAALPSAPHMSASRYARQAVKILRQNFKKELTCTSLSICLSKLFVSWG